MATFWAIISFLNVVLQYYPQSIKSYCTFILKRPCKIILPSAKWYCVCDLNQEDDDDKCDLSEVTTSGSSDDISWTYDWSLVHSLSPEWEPNICDTDIQSR